MAFPLVRIGSLELAPDKLLFWLLLALLLWAPIPLGSNRVWAWSLLEVATFAILGAWLLLWAFGLATVSDAIVKSWPALALLALWLLYLSAYLLPLPPGVVAFLSPEAARMHALTDAIGVARPTMTLSVDPHASRAFLLKSLAYSGIFFLVLALANNRSRVTTLARALVYGA